MLQFKRFISILSVIGLLSSCSTINQPVDRASAVNCPTQPASLPDEVWISRSGEFVSYFEPFSYAPEQIEADSNTIRLMAQQYDFVFCRGDRSWSVQPGSLRSATLSRNPRLDDRSNPGALEFNDKTYRYRVLTEPNLPNEPQQVVFELTEANRPPQRHVLYTLKDVQQGRFAGARLGQARITAAFSQGDRLWWAVAFEQGEGNNGIATIVSYDPATEKTVLIQPPELSSQQILDLAVTGDTVPQARDRDRPTLWMGTKTSAEGMGNIPTMGLVAYPLDWQNPNAGTAKSYTIHNSPLVGAIPTRLRAEGDTLWVGTRNGACALEWQTPDSAQSWSCWRFTAVADLPSGGVPLYSSLLSSTPATTLEGSIPFRKLAIEVLWWRLTDPQGLTLTTEPQQGKGRYEVRYAPGFTTTLNQGGSMEEPNFFVPAGEPRVHWMGEDWHWTGDRFVRSLDHVAGDRLGFGDRGIGVGDSDRIDWKAMRGDLDLLDLTSNTTSVRYYSGWVEGDALKPHPAVVPQERPDAPRSNPLAQWSPSN